MHQLRDERITRFLSATVHLDGSFANHTWVTLLFGGRRMAHPTHPNFTAKMMSKEYDHYSGYPGGRKVRPAAELLERRPEEILRLAVRRMLPKNKLGRHMLKKLKLYRGTVHPHQSQAPQPTAL